MPWVELSRLRSPRVMALEGLISEQVREWASGQRPPLKLLIDRHPALFEDPTAVLELINQEIVLRHIRGEVPRPEDYANYFPELAEPLAALRGPCAPSIPPELCGPAARGRGRSGKCCPVRLHVDPASSRLRDRENPGPRRNGRGLSRAAPALSTKKSRSNFRTKDSNPTGSIAPASSGGSGGRQVPASQSRANSRDRRT